MGKKAARKAGGLRLIGPFHMEIFWSEPIRSEISAALLLKREVGEGRETMATFPPKPHDPFPMWHIPEPWKGEGGAREWGRGWEDGLAGSPAQRHLVSYQEAGCELGEGQIWMCSQGFLVVYGILRSPVRELFLTKKTHGDWPWNLVQMKVCARDCSITAEICLRGHNTFSFSYFFQAIWRFLSGLKCSLGALDLLQVQKRCLGSSVK